MNILDIGCGNKKYKSPHHFTVGLDMVKTKDTDIIYDMEKPPYPFKTSSFNLIIMSHTLEHISRENRTNLRVIEEIYRLLTPKGRLIATMPFGQAFQYDPTHKNPVSHWFWKYFSPNHPLNYYTTTRFNLISSKVVGLHGLPHLESFTPIVNYLYQLSPSATERIIGFLNLDIEIKFTLKKV